MSPSVTVIIPTYNRTDLLEDCLNSLSQQTYKDFRVLIVDDGSEENIEAFASEKFPDVDVLRMPKNRGFAATVNAGIRKADSEYLFLLNNDMTLDENCLQHLVAASEHADMVAPLVVWKDDPTRIYSAGDRLRTNGRPEPIGFREDAATFHHPDTVFGVSAGAALYRKSLFDEIGVFDERFVAYFEDSDLSFRARLAGFTAACTLDAVAYHIGSASLEGRTWWRARQCYRNHALLVIKNMPWAVQQHHATEIALERLHQTRRLISAARTEFGLARALLEWFKAYAEVLLATPYALAQRSAIQRNRKLATYDLEALLSP